ncbi:hypothetical protein OAG86_01480 [Akkermansiaceae bacterium]|nr:hypothetical protein [Akkermansiaceae bacterium]
MNFRSWRSNLDQIISEIQRVALGDGEIKILSINDRVSFGLPKDKSLAREVVNLYRPMKWKARLVAAMLKKFVGFGGARLLKPVSTIGNSPEISWLNNEATIGFLGCNPGHGLRCIVLSREGHEQIKVTKLAVGGNVAPVRNEGMFLERVSGRVPGLPRYGGSSVGGDWAAFWTEYLPKNGPRELGGKLEIALLNSWLGETRVKLKHLFWVEKLLAEAPSDLCLRLDNIVIKEALLHGDFTPWNLRSGREGLVAIDWEWAREDGIGGVDLGHGLIMQGKLVYGLQGEGLVDYVLSKISGEEQAKYLSECGWDDEKLWLAFFFAICATFCRC